MICQNNTCQIINSHAIMRVKVTHKWGATLVAAKMVSTHQFQNKKGLIIFVCLQFTELTTRKLLWTFSKFYGRVGILCILVTFPSHLKKEKLHLVKYDFSGNSNYFPKFVFFVFSHTLHFQNHTTKFEIKYMVHACIYFTCT